MEEEARRLIHELVGFWEGGFGIRYPIVGDPCQWMAEQGGIVRRGEELKQGFGQRAPGPVPCTTSCGPGVLTRAALGDILGYVRCSD